MDMTFLNLGAEFQTLDNLKPTSPFYELKNSKMPKTSCWQSHRGLGPLVDTVVLQQKKIGNADDSADGAGATGAMFQGRDGEIWEKVLARASHCERVWAVSMNLMQIG